VGPHETKKETLEFLERGRERWEDNEAASYVIRPREGEDGAGEIAGFGGFSVDWEKRTAVLGTWLRKRFWGRGYSGERAAALVEVAFENLDLDLVAVSHLPENAQSQRAIEKYRRPTRRPPRGVVTESHHRSRRQRPRRGPVLDLAGGVARGDSVVGKQVRTTEMAIG